MFDLTAPQHEAGRTVIPSLQMGKLRPRVTRLVSKKGDLQTGWLPPESMVGDS